MENFNFTAKKSLGQNFLHAPQVIATIVYAVKINLGDIILEAGPGKGALTEKLLEAGAKVIAVEKDSRAIPYLKEKFKKEVEEGQLLLIEGDILEFEPSKYGLKAEHYSIAANIPYYISGEFLRKFLESPEHPTRMVVMLQKELAKRITDEKGSILSVSVKVYGNPKYLTSVPRKFFRPMPNVDSALLLIDNISKKFFETSGKDGKIQINDEKRFFEVLKVGFAHKRKVLIKNLEEKIPKEALGKLWKEHNWSLTMRAEELSPVEWKNIVG